MGGPGAVDSVVLRIFATALVQVCPLLFFPHWVIGEADRCLAPGTTILSIETGSMVRTRVK